ncbi:putative reverse transcriptase domain-containing protein [Tanacetum coccineum]|uniref:Reverse transcriptase domain-containing protein n=1 Tax=Tanacetum coccineum TaxID=301880 RepID=A0ABQ4WCZ8_9ASTR
MLLTSYFRRVVVAKTLGYIRTSSRSILNFVQGAHDNGATQLLKRQRKDVANFCAKFIHQQVLKQEAYATGDIETSVQKSFLRSRLESFVIVIHFVEYLAHYLLKRSFFVSCVMYIMTSRSRTRASIQELFGGVTDWYPEPRLWQLWLFLSSDFSDESVGSSFSRVILIGSISVKVSVASNVGAAAVASPVGVLELDTYSSSKADPSEKSDTKIPERHVSPTPHDAMLTRWRSRVASRSSSHTTSTPEIPTAPTPSTPPVAVAPSTDIILPVNAPPGIPLRYTSHHLDRFTFGSSSDHSSSDHSSSDHSSSGHSISSHSVSRHTPLVTTIADSSTPLRFVYTPLARTPRYSEAYRRWRSAPLSTMYPPMTYKSSALDSSSESSTGPSCKRCRSPVATMTSSIHALRALVPSHADLLRPRKSFRDFISPKGSVKEDIDTNLLADIEADATANEVAIDMDVEAGVDAGISMEVDVEDEVDGKVESSDRGTIEVGVDVVARINIPDGMLMPDAMERLEQVEEAVQDIYGHVIEIPLQRVEDIETGQRNLEARSLIAGGERASLLDQVTSLERSNTRLQGTLMMKSTRADRFQRRVGFMERELRQIHRFRYYDRMRFRRLETFPVSQNGYDDDNRNVRGDGNRNGRGNGDRNDGLNGNGNEGGNRNGNPNRNDIVAMPVARECTYHDFRELMKLMTEVNCPRNEIQKMESELWNLTVKNNDLATYTQRFQELTMMCTKMVPEEEYRNVGGQSMARAYTAGNNEKKGYTGPLPYCNKCKLHHEGPCTVKCEKCNKVGHMVRDCMNIVAATTTQRALVVNQRVPTCFECGRQGHYRNECPKLKNQTYGNKAGKKTNKARGKAYVLGG